MTTAARALADEGTDAVLAADCSVVRDYAPLVREAVEGLKPGAEITAESIRSWVEAHHPDAQPHHCNVLGAVFRELANAGRIRPVGWTEATRPESRGRALRVWQVTS